MESRIGKFINCYAAALLHIRYGSQSFQGQGLELNIESQELRQSEQSSSLQKDTDFACYRKQSQVCHCKTFQCSTNRDFEQPPTKDIKLYLRCEEFNRSHIKAELYCQSSEEFDRGKKIIEEKRVFLQDGLPLGRVIGCV